jgi:lipopolysaccharide assembly protein A
MTTDPQPAPNPASAETPLPTPPEGLPALEPQSQVPPPASPAPSKAEPPRTTQVPPQHRVKRTRTSGVWVAVAFFAVVLLLLLIFILQNGAEVSVSYLGAHGHLPLGVALLLAAVCGILLVVLAGAARISQLRAVNRRHRRADAKRSKAAAKEPAGPGR